MVLHLGIDRMVGLGLLLANELFDVPIPEVYNEYLDQTQEDSGEVEAYVPYENLWARERYFYLEVEEIQV